MMELGLALVALGACMVGWVAGYTSRNKEVAAWREVERMGPPGACGQCGLDFDGTAVRYCVNGRLDCPVAVYAVEGVRTLDDGEAKLLRKVLQFAKDEEGITVDMIPLDGRNTYGAPSVQFTAEDIARLSVLEEQNEVAEQRAAGLRP